MEAFVKRNDLPLFPAVQVPAQARQLAGGLVCLGAAMAEKCLTFKRVATQSLREFDLRRGVKSVAHVPEPRASLGGGADKVGGAVPRDQPAESREQVEVFVSVVVPKPGAFA